MLVNVLKFSQMDAPAWSRMRDGECADPRDRTENCKHFELEAERHLELKVRACVSLVFGERAERLWVTRICKDH